MENKEADSKHGSEAKRMRTFRVGVLSWPTEDHFATEREYSRALSADMDEPIHECEGNELFIEGFGVRVTQTRNLTQLKLGPEFMIQKNETPEDHFKRMNVLLEKAMKENHDQDMQQLEQDFKKALRKQIDRITDYLSSH